MDNVLVDTQAIAGDAREWVGKDGSSFTDFEVRIQTMCALIIL